MTVGSQPSSTGMDQTLTGLAVQMRNVMQQISNLSTNVNGQAQGLSFLESIGYDTADAQLAQNLISYMNTVAGVYYGTAVQATEFDFNQELSQLWGGQ